MIVKIQAPELAKDAQLAVDHSSQQNALRTDPCFALLGPAFQVIKNVCHQLRLLLVL